MKHTQQQLRDAEDKRFSCPPLPAMMTGVSGDVFRVDAHGGTIFFRSHDRIVDRGAEYPAGTVFTLSHYRGVNLIDRFDSNDRARALWCKITKTKPKELRAIVKRRQAERDAASRTNDVKHFLERAKKLGFKVVEA